MRRRGLGFWRIAGRFLKQSTKGKEFLFFEIINFMLEKPESKLNIPEQEKKKYSLGKIFCDLKKKIKNSIGFLFESEEDKKIREFEKKLQESQDISKAAGEFFRFLIPGSLKQPEKEYENTEKEEDYLQTESDFLQSIKELKRKMKAKDFKEAQQVFIEKHESDDEVVGNTKEEKIGNIIEQTRIFNFKQEGGENTIKEIVNNLLDKLGEANYAAARALIVKDLKTGVKLDLSQLLPGKTELCPSDLCKFEWYIDKEEEKTKAKFISTDLESYKGTKGSEGRFSAGKGKVFYGDLTKRGGLLSLLHEVAHEWQFIYYKDSGRKNFRVFFNKIHADLSILSYF